MPIKEETAAALNRFDVRLSPAAAGAVAERAKPKSGGDDKSGSLSQMAERYDALMEEGRAWLSAKGLKGAHLMIVADFIRGTVIEPHTVSSTLGDLRDVLISGPQDTEDEDAEDIISKWGEDNCAKLADILSNASIMEDFALVDAAERYTNAVFREKRSNSIVNPEKFI